MGLYKLDTKNGEDLEKGRLEKVIVGKIDYEKDFENWLENSPDILFEEDEGNTIIWIGRQVRATMANANKYPDLMGIDASGNLVIVELKKGKTPREVVAQTLEYSAWASTLSYESLNKIYIEYARSKQEDEPLDLRTKHKEVFFPEGLEDLFVKFNNNQKIYIVAEEISSTIQDVTEYLRNTYGMDIYCLEYTVYKTEQNEYIINTEKIGNSLKLVQLPKQNGKNTERWSKSVKVKEVIYKAVLNFTKQDPKKAFAPVDIYNEIIKEYPDINRSTVGCQLIQDCVNHTSRKHYPSGQQDLYYLESKGRYRLYSASSDGKWTWQGKQITE
ncbi:hypothetical protein CJ195_22395 [Bacillus sp. UMB0899]|nr:hypothetical protein CJ195_22395 [Bacillus sp. UMB0899]